MLRTRTHLTTPPGGSPVTETGNADAFELYTSGLALPTEPVVPGRFRTQIIVLVAVLVLALIGWIAFQQATAGQDQDPSLDQNLIPDEGGFDPTVEIPDDAG